MLGRPFRLGRIFGIPIGVDFSWFIVFVLITLSLSTQFSGEHPHWSTIAHTTFGVTTSLLFFASVLLHELGHSVVALHYGIPVKSITLFIFGGLAQIAREPERPFQEFNIALAGPMVSAALGGLFLGVSMAVPAAWEGIASQTLWLGRINLFLALFNMIPGFPLDGGRVLRAMLWRYTGSYERATGMATTSGQVVAYLFIFAGVTVALTGNFFSGLWIGFIGWFLLNAAQTAAVQVKFRTALAGIKARHVMTGECVRTPGSLSIAEAVEVMLQQGSRCSMIVDGQRFRGLITLHEIKRVPREEWATTSLQAVMVPESSIAKVLPDADIDTVLQIMNDQNVGQVPVVEGGDLVGVIGRDRVLTLIQTHLDLKS